MTFHLKEAIAQQTEEEMETDPNRGQTLNVATQDLQFNRAGKEPELEDAIASMEITVPPPQIPLESEGAKGTRMIHQTSFLKKVCSIIWAAGKS